MTTEVPQMTQHIYDFIREYWRTNQLSPSLREIGQACYLNHSSVIVHLAKLEALEWVIRDVGIARSIRLGSRGPASDSNPINA